MNKTGIDYLKFRTQTHHFGVLEALRPHFSAGDLLCYSGAEAGKDGWEFRKRLMISDLQIGTVDYGGDSQRGWVRVDIPGKGCDWVGDWKGMAGLYEALSNAELRRVDVKLDTWDGSISHEGVLAAYEAGDFKREGGGRNPKLKKVETSCVTDGRTIYVGARTSARFIRCYEKGWEMVNKAGIPQQHLSPALKVDFEEGQGMTLVRDRYRVEVEFKAVDGVVIPWPMLESPDSYFAGASPFCASLVDAAPRRAQALPSDFMPKATLAASMENCRVAYGGLLRALLELYGDSPDAKLRIFDELAGDKPSARLIQEGVLTLSV